MKPHPFGCGFFCLYWIITNCKLLITLSIANYPCFSLERADFGSQVVEVMETAEVGSGWDSSHGIHIVQARRCQDKQTTGGTSIKPLFLGFPIGIDRFFLYMDEGKTPLQTFVLEEQFATRDAGCDCHRGTIAWAQAPRSRRENGRACRRWPKRAPGCRAPLPWLVSRATRRGPSHLSPTVATRGERHHLPNGPTADCAQSRLT